MSEEKEPWNPPKALATCCGDVIWSKYPGQFAACKCGKSFVDQTRYYGRAGGSIEPYNEEYRNQADGVVEESK